MNKPLSLSYRPDIDGLRALAVLLVIGFHYFPDSIPNGFLGVDVFFVISGFLITGIILRGLEADTFTIMDFYERRVRRIFPALLVLLCAAIILGWFLLIAIEYKQLTNHISAAAIFVSNFLLWSEGDYFDNEAYTKPLLHLWSLAVEEQFYLIWPIVLMSLYRLSSKNTFIFILIFFSSSLLLQIILSVTNPTAAFYFPLARAWELMVGAILAYMTFHIRFANLLLRVGELKHITSLVGFALLFSPLLLISNASWFYSGLALIPVLGVTLLIAAGVEGWVNRFILKNKILVGIGLISYPLYLWHWFILSMARILKGSMPDDATKKWLIGLSFILAIFTYFFIEKPLRFSEQRKVISLGLVIVMTIIGVLGFLGYRQGGLKFREGESYFFASKFGDIGNQVFYEYLLNKNFFPCQAVQFLDAAPKWGDFKRCRQSKPNGQHDLTIIGDSHGEHLFVGLAEALPNYNVVYYTRGSLPSIQNQDFLEIYKYVAKSGTKTVIISAYWTAYFNTVNKSSPLAFASQLIETTSFLTKSGISVYLIDDVPFFSFDPQVCKYRRGVGVKTTCSADERNYRYWYNQIISELSKVSSADPNVTLVRTDSLFCKGTNCSMANGDELLYRDKNHLNLNGTRFVGKYLTDTYLKVGLLEK